ncbi:MAG: DegT/DnrJ/EryC1/StrS family aminotransferase [Thermoguttaceae bacterium]|nr:DegT/DnrJ/EryC1/StrS family aminotransferase [Thermoguttaceae bacterium]MDW8037684.1 DegT/DnrJ/EryC1/StrS family aminotransferase [Thermoguttaceae bacterium]
MWVRMRFDIGWSDILYGIASTGRLLDRRRLEWELRHYWTHPEQIFPCLSVRTGFDLFWAVVGLPAGSEVMMTALTIPDMPRIVAHHGLTPVPVDVEPSTMAPGLQMLERAVSPRSRAIVVAHLFGILVPMEPIIDFARRHHLLVLEDCAQGFIGRGYEGHPESDVVMFSFGPIKTATALGGAILRVRDPELLRRMQERHAQYPRQDRRAYLKRLLKYAVLKAACSRPICDLVIATCRMAEWDHDQIISNAARGFPGPGFFQRIRCQPPDPLLAMLVRRLWNYPEARLQERIARGSYLVGLLPSELQRPGNRAKMHSFWVFPILAENPPAVIATLARAGFDATSRSSLRLVPTPENRPHLHPVLSQAILDRVVFLPFGREIPPRALRQMAELLAGLGSHLTGTSLEEMVARGVSPIHA